ncbi:phage tail tube protein [Thermosporothrix hazakensis]|jgi:hypothetical protein|uniref:Phage tail tube protein n=1 Tax=Thermosporothrix hazakensis TaxID=644383 RepID=A0A326TUH7_THEHA|nr:phage tail tube protein [Thermosporothrix hazakensis]PZW19689.1 phage tail tube protein [Thermosporothrix hazakensis]GCE49199.1 hypothetical protein KTH_40680 [Thermosporothrix hazakensis]
MAKAAYSAVIKVGSTIVHDISSVELPFKTDLEETTAFSSSAPGTKTFIPTLRGMETKLSGNWNVGDPGQQALEDAYFGRQLVQLEISPDGVKKYSFDAWIGEYSIKADVSGKIEVEYSVTINGDVTRA